MRPCQATTLLSRCLLLAGAAALPAAAQQAGERAPERAEMYLPAYFRDVAPSNAYDMVLRLPGFTLVEADADVRGYAGASGNVLFDGARPTSKRESIAEQLKRIPVGAVERIELIRAGTPGIDMGGQSMLANIVRHRDASTEWAVQAGAIASTDGWLQPQAQLEYGRRWNDRALDLSFKREPELDDDSGEGSIVTRSGATPEAAREAWRTRTGKREDEANVGWRQPFGPGRLTLTAALRGETKTTRSVLGQAADEERIGEDEDFRESELGIRYVRPFGEDTTLEAMASRQRGRLRGVEDSREGEDSERFEENTDSGETIGRIELTHARNARLSFNAALESARNFLHSDNRLYRSGALVALPGARTRIEERRTETSAGLTWHPRKDWTVEAGMRLERSNLTQSGDIGRQRRFTYPKPRVAVRWVASESDQWRISLSREVSQLVFEDFAASASLDGGTVSAGNAELHPDRSWRSTLAWEHHFNEDAALTLGWTHDRIEDVVDRVLVTDGGEVFDAPGNIGDGRRDTLALELSAPLPWQRLPGMRLRASLLWRDSRVTDPVTGRKRGISEEKPVEGEIEVTQDLPGQRLNWGLLLEHIDERKTKYRYDRITTESEDMGWTLFAERRVGAHWRLRADITDLFGREFRETRNKYQGTRADGTIRETERRQRTSPGTISVTIRRSIGG